MSGFFFLLIMAVVIFIILEISALPNVGENTNNDIKKTKSITLKYCGGNTNVVKECKCAIEFLEESMSVSYKHWGEMIHEDLGVDYSSVSFEGMSEQQVRNDVTLTRLALFGVFALGMKKQKTSNVFLILMKYVDIDGKSQQVIMESDMSIQQDLKLLNKWLRESKDK